MSSLYGRSKEYTRSRKAQSDSPPSSPSPIAKTLRVSSFFLSLFPAGGSRWCLVGAALQSSALGFVALAGGCFGEEAWEGASGATGLKQLPELSSGSCCVNYLGSCWGC